MFKNPRCWTGLGLLMVLAGTAFLIASVSTKHWLSGSDKVKSTIFQACFWDICIQKHFFVKSAATLILGIIMACAALILVSIALCWWEKSTLGCCSVRFWLLFAEILAILAVPVFTSCIVFANEHGDLKDNDITASLGYSFYLAVVGGVLLFSGGILSICAGVVLKPDRTDTSASPAPNAMAMKNSSEYAYDQGPIEIAPHPRA